MIMKSPVEKALDHAKDAWCLGSVLMEQQILHLHHEHHMSPDDIAKRTGMGIETVVATCQHHHEEKNLAIN